MRIKGKKIEGPNIEIIVIPREKGDIVFKAQAVLDMDQFDQLCPVPEAPMMMRRIAGEMKHVPDIENTVYKAHVKEHSEKRFAYIMLKSLEATEGLEWETVDINDPTTWKNYETELHDAGFNYVEVNRITSSVLAANSLSEEKLEEARARFLAGQVAAVKESSSPKDDQLNMPLGDLASVSVLGHQESETVGTK